MFPSEECLGGAPQEQLLWECGQGQYYGQKGALNVPSLTICTASFIFLSQHSLILGEPVSSPKQVLRCSQEKSLQSQEKQFLGFGVAMLDLMLLK